MTIIHLQNLTCRYGDFSAVKDLSFSVEKGEIFGFLGPNGAGKTTTLRTMLDFIRPASGKIEIFGLDSRQHTKAIKQRIGYLGSELVLWENWTGESYLRWIEDLRETPILPEAHRLAEALDFDLKRSLKGMSTGMKRKIGLITTLAPKPELLILDEPTIGLDPLMQKAFKELMREIRDEGRTVFLSSHDLQEVETICDRVAIIRQGELQKIENVDNLTSLGFRWVTVRFTDKDAIPIESFQNLPGLSEVHFENETLKIRMGGEVDMNAFLKHLATFDVQDLNFDHPNLEEIFLTFYGEGA
jgi:ABC-2 type transport system ATP-binding protein